MTIQMMYNPLTNLHRRIGIIMYDVLKNLVLILLALFAPVWFPITQKIFNGVNITGKEWLVLVLIFVLPVLGLWYGEKENERKNKEKRLREMVNSFKIALQESGLVKPEQGKDNIEKTDS